jgi:hypothetical protein
MESRDPEQFARYLAAVVVLAGDSSLEYDLDNGYDTAVAIVHDGSGFTPGAAIHISETNSPHDALEQAHDMLRRHVIATCPEHVAELQAEWGDRWEEILTETFDGRVWVLNPYVAACAIKADKFACAHVAFE